MGNIFDVESQPPPATGNALMMTEAEQQALKSLYEGLCENQGELSEEKLVAKFSASNRKTFRSIFVAHVMKHIKSYQDFEDFIIRCTRKSSSTTIEEFWGMISDNPDVYTKWYFSSLLYMAFEIAFVDGDTASENEGLRVTEEYAEFIRISAHRHHANLEDNSALVLETALTEINSFAPHLAKVFETYISSVCFGKLLSPAYTPFRRPRLDAQSEIVDEYDLMPLALYSDNAQGSWKRLYTSSFDGNSFNRIAHHILGYDGPTCILIKCQDAVGTVLGAMVNERWKEHNRFFGSSQDILFTLAPKLRIYRSKAHSNGFYQWLNTKSYNLPHGLGFGGTMEGFRLFIPESLETCTAQESCPTYEPGRLVEAEGGEFQIGTLEIWGCGGEEKVASALQAQEYERQLEEENIQKARHVDKAAFFNNEFDREMFLSNTVSNNASAKRMGNS